MIEKLPIFSFLTKNEKLPVIWCTYEQISVNYRNRVTNTGKNQLRKND